MERDRALKRLDVFVGEWGMEATFPGAPPTGPMGRTVFEWMAGERFPALNFTKWPVTVDGDRVGKVTSAIHSPRLGRNIGYAWVPAEHSDPGVTLTVETPAGAREASVVPMPFVDPGKEIPKS